MWFLKSLKSKYIQLAKDNREQERHASRTAAKYKKLLASNTLCGGCPEFLEKLSQVLLTDPEALGDSKKEKGLEAEESLDKVI